MKLVLTIVAIALTAGLGGAEDWNDRLDLSGDLRIRWEGFDQEGAFDDGHRSRLRYRARLKLEAEINDRLSVTLGLRSGSATNPVSDNVSFDSGLNRDDFRFAEASVDFKATDSFHLLAGKIDPRKHWSASDLAWDGDVTTEGFMQVFRPDRWTITTFEFLLEESSRANESYQLGGQLARSFDIASARLEAGIGYEVTTEPDAIVGLRLSGKLGGNPLTNTRGDDGLLESRFEVFHVRGSLSTTIADDLPFKVELFAYRNLGAAGLGADLDTAVTFRTTIGDAKKKTRLRVRYTYYRSEPDALLFAYTQSDLSFGTDVEAHRLDALYKIGPSAISLTVYHNEKLTVDEPRQLRWQLDWSVKF